MVPVMANSSSRMALKLSPSALFAPINLYTCGSFTEKVQEREDDGGKETATRSNINRLLSHPKVIRDRSGMVGKVPHNKYSHMATEKVMFSIVRKHKQKC